MTSHTGRTAGPTLSLLAALVAPVLLYAQAPAEHDHREVRISTPDSAVTLAGTLSLPAGRPDAPVAVFLTGSGDHPRDQVISGTPMFRVMADHLLAAGFGALRLDDRGTAESTGPTTTASTTADRVADMRAAVAYLAGTERLEPIILIGHSEGAAVAAAVAAAEPRVAGLILLGAPARPGAVVWLDQQMAGIATHLGRDVSELGEVQALLSRIIDASVAGESAAEIEAHTLPFFTAIGLDLETARDDGTVEHFVGRLSSPWFRYFLGHDPTGDYARITVPVLALYGAIDRLTSPALNLDALARAMAGNERVTLRVLPEQDHFFLRAEGLAPGEHKFGQMHVAPELLAELVAWLQARPFGP